MVRARFPNKDTSNVDVHDVVDVNDVDVHDVDVNVVALHPRTTHAITQSNIYVYEMCALVCNI